VPVFVWWRSVPDVENYVLQHLARMADRVVFDSTISSYPRRGFPRLARLLKEDPNFPAVTDFAWQRLTPWREMVASFYDMPDHRPYLDRVDSLRIEYHPHSATSDITSRAILFASWLAERLQWTLDKDASSNDGDDNRFVFRKGDREIVTTFVPVVRAGFEDLLASATLSARGDDSAEFRVTRSEIKQLASEIRFRGAVHTSRVLSYRSKSEAELLATELGIAGHDRLYEAALKIAGQIASVSVE
jgi:glucose-6-phosphate dehydrogenase assembly protein OpcA